MAWVVLGWLAWLTAAPAVAAAPQGLMVERPDGTNVHYYLDRSPSRRRQPLLLMFAGSGCDSITTNARLPWMARQLAPRHAVLMVDKYGVSSGQGGDSCSSDFRRGNTLQQRVLDALQVIAALRRERWWNRDIVLFGGSEGGAVAAMLAPLVPETRAVIIWSSGIGLPIGQMIRSALPPQMAVEAERVFAEARANPSGDREWAGASYRWWADAVDLVPARSLLLTPAPVLVIHGTRDESAPVASARATRDLLASGNKPNFGYREYEGYDHFMTDAAGVDRRAEVLASAAEWLRDATR